MAERVPAGRNKTVASAVLVESQAHSFFFDLKGSD
jgi:hypothetical protein